MNKVSELQLVIARALEEYYDDVIVFDYACIECERGKEDTPNHWEFCPTCGDILETDVVIDRNHHDMIKALESALLKAYDFNE